MAFTSKVVTAVCSKISISIIANIENLSYYPYTCDWWIVLTYRNNWYFPLPFRKFSHHRKIDSVFLSTYFMFVASTGSCTGKKWSADLSENKPREKRMLLHRVKSLFYGAIIIKETNTISRPFLRSTITTPSGAILPEPKRTPFSFLGVVSSVVFGLLVGATISKNIANFLEENDLFVPSDDDDDDDDN